MAQYKIVCIPAGTPIGGDGWTLKADRYKLFYRRIGFMPWSRIGLLFDKSEEAEKAARDHQMRKSVRKCAKPPYVIKQWTA